MKLNWNDLSKYRNQLYGIAMLWIIVFHVWETFQKKMTFNWTISFIVKNGNIGVDLFLFLSGISMYYAIRKYVKEDGSIRVWDFYKKRISKILKVYLLFCVPYLVINHLIVKYDVSMFMQQLLFQRKNVSSFWFLLGITICYLLYPALYKCIAKGKKGYIYGFIALYIAGLFLLCTYHREYYMRYEILFSRIPVFAAGALCGEKVYKKEEVNPYGLFTAVLLLLSRGPVFFVLQMLPFYSSYERIFRRLHGGVLGVCAIFFLIMLLKYIEQTKLSKFLGFLGTFTLEVYVLHIAYRVVLLNYLNIKVVSYKETFLFLIFYTVTSFVLGYFLSLGLNKIKLKGKTKNSL